MSQNLAGDKRSYHPDARREHGRSRPDTGARRPDPETANEFLSRRESESFTGGPGVVATKSQARGATGGFFLGGIAGAIIGIVAGFLMFEGAAAIITIVSFAVAGSVFGGVFGGIAGGSSKAGLGHEKADL